MEIKNEAVPGYEDIHQEKPYIDAYTVGEVAYIDTLYVPPPFRKQGIGAKLVNDWLATLEPGVKRVKLMAATLGGSDSMKFWKKLGFTPAYTGALYDEIENALTLGVNGYSTPAPEVIAPEDDCRHWIEDVEDELHFQKNPQVKTTLTLYHGTKLDNFFQRFDAALSGKGVGANAFDQGNKFYLTESLPAAKWFAAMAEQNRTLLDDKTTLDDLGKVHKLSGSVIEFDATKARIKQLEYMPRGFDDYHLTADELIEQARQEGFDAVSFPDRGFDTVEGDRFVHDMMTKHGLPRSIIVINHDKFIASRLLSRDESAKVLTETNHLNQLDLTSIDLNDVTVTHKKQLTQAISL
ncbi:GNAT family N-acetyltransferase [Cellvibrio sp. QJXJ]|uniref:GNAT family N-acetyltransferase n=1 Tax=Cellvibrio sp. QJXJ TaxID=2964606 RepID=UPI0021C37F27|nr:GNAT family N-acetyltransferase [Cellvibrio sp. QJXJ]UUA75258.1 GNAT family N-acetyltransferase [Cellvibrio sp. QJXJ]